MPRLYRKALLLPIGLLLSCQGTDPLPAEAPVLSGNKPDFSGHWEKDYRQSDDFNARFALYIADIQRRYSSQQSGAELRAISAIAIRSEAINGLARFAEEITRMPLLEIEHADNRIAVEREQDFTLRCHYENREYSRSLTSFGADLCGWFDQQFLFQMNLAGGLGITHQFSLNADRSLLSITTTVTSDTVAAPMVIRNIYHRYDVPEQDYNCMLTLTRNTVCSQRGEPK